VALLHRRQYFATVMSSLMHRAVADERDHRPLGMRELRRDRVRHARPHRRERARKRRHHPPPQLEIAREPVGGGAGVGGEDAVVGETRRKLPEDELRIDRVRRLLRAIGHQVPPVLHRLLDPVTPRAVLLPLEQRQQHSQRFRRVADQLHLHRVPDADAPCVDVDLDSAGIAFARKELRVREARAHHQQRVAVRHQLPARPGAEEADRTGDEREVVR
jgi:hypothetical protein